MVPPGSLDEEASNVTARGATPVRGVKVNEAMGEVCLDICFLLACVVEATTTVCVNARPCSSRLLPASAVCLSRSAVRRLSAVGGFGLAAGRLAPVTSQYMLVARCTLFEVITIVFCNLTLLDFTGETIYPLIRCFLQKSMALAKSASDHLWDSMPI